jgi:hypothetical protein
MKKKTTAVAAPRPFVPGRQCRSLHGKVVDWVEHKFEEGLLYIHVRFVDKTELCWRLRRTVRSACRAVGEFVLSSKTAALFSSLLRECNKEVGTQIRILTAVFQ